MCTDYFGVDATCCPVGVDIWGELSEELVRTTVASAPSVDLPIGVVEPLAAS